MAFSDVLVQWFPTTVPRNDFIFELFQVIQISNRQLKVSISSYRRIFLIKTWKEDENIKKQPIPATKYRECCVYKILPGFVITEDALGQTQEILDNHQEWLITIVESRC